MIKYKKKRNIIFDLNRLNAHRESFNGEVNSFTPIHQA